MKKIILKIEGMSCSACSTGLEKYLNKQKGIKFASVNLVMQQVMIEYEESLTINEINNFIREAGFKSLGEYEEREDNKNYDNILLIYFSLLSLIVLYISMSHMIHIPVIPFLNMENYPINYSICLLILTIPYLFYGFDILKNGYKNLLHLIPNMDTLVSIGVISSFLYSLFSTIMILSGKSEYVESIYYESICIVIFFIKLGRFIDQKSKTKTKEAIKDLVTITPSKAILKTKTKEQEVTIDEIKKGDIIICKPGSKIAVDGIIVNGIARLDESFITGESIPVKKDIGKKVLAGSMNIDGFIEYQALGIGKDSTISEIVRLVVEATNTKAPISKIADKVSSIFVPSIILVSILTFITYLLLGYSFNISLTHFVTVLVVACPCALGLATPLAIVVSVGISAKNGILIKTSETLEKANKIDTIVFDKTGTLTYGKLKISKVYNYSNYSEKELLTIVASLEDKSNHPIAISFKNYANEFKLKLLEVKKFQNQSGLGLSAMIDKNKYYVGNNKILEKLNIKNDYLPVEKNLSMQGNSIVYVIENKKIIALIGVKDIVRLNTKQVISKLKKMNKQIIMLTGDNEITAKIVTKEVGIDEVIANVMPKDKTLKIKELLNNNKLVMMVGDGINDAPALATATIGVSVSSGTDIANNSSDVILLNDKIINLVNLIMISKKTISNIKQNLFWAFFYNSLMIPIAIGLFSKWNITMNPMFAGIAMTLSSLTVVFNALRLRKTKLERG